MKITFGAALTAALMVLSLGGCMTGAADKEIQFGPDSKTAIVVFGWEGLDRWRGLTVAMQFKGVDANGAQDGRQFFVSNGNGWEEMQRVEYYVVEVAAGAYVAHSTHTHLGYGQNIALFCDGTVRFEAPAGKAVFIGNFVAPRGPGAVTLALPQFAQGAAKLAEYSNVKQSLELAQMRMTPYPGTCKRGSIFD